MVSIQAQYAEAVSKKVAYDGRGGYFAQVKAKSTIYGKVNEDDSKLNDLYDKYLLLDEEVNLEKNNTYNTITDNRELIGLKYKANYKSSSKDIDKEEVIKLAQLSFLRKSEIASENVNEFQVNVENKDKTRKLDLVLRYADYDRTKLCYSEDKKNFKEIDSIVPMYSGEKFYYGSKGEISAKCMTKDYDTLSGDMVIGNIFLNEEDSMINIMDIFKTCMSNEENSISNSDGIVGVKVQVYVGSDKKKLLFFQKENENYTISEITEEKNDIYYLNDFE